MSEQELECQNHANCGDYCNTPREREMVLCEGCLDSFDQQQADQEELRTLRAEAEALRAELDHRKALDADGLAFRQELIQQRDSARTELEAAWGLLREVDDYLSRRGDGEAIHTGSKFHMAIDAFLTATPAQEVQTEQGGRKEAVVDDLVFLVDYIWRESCGLPRLNDQALRRHPLDVAKAALADHHQTHRKGENHD